MTTARMTIFADDPLIQNGSDATNFWMVVFGANNLGSDPLYRGASFDLDLLGNGAFPTGTSTMTSTQIGYITADNWVAATVTTTAPLTIAGGHAHRFDTYVQMVYLGLKDSVADPYFASEGMTR